MLCLLERAHAVVEAGFLRRASTSTLSRSNRPTDNLQVITVRSANGEALRRKADIRVAEQRYEVKRGDGSE